ncbi:MAG: hypothetical protein VR78_08085 [Hoeflea sp. BRH_c9]|nr:MAG: hypothetical protein VR78_08085 [Hoeflea sp. BRH_c9]MDP2732883.1 hypothetical protein [Hoeflea sp.]
MLTPPPRDENNNVTPHDHAGIANSDGIIRRVSEKQVVTDKFGNRVLSSYVFKASSSGAYPGKSVDLEALIMEAGIDPKVFVTTPRWCGSIRYTAGLLRGLGLQVGFEPLEEEHPHPANPYHGEVWGDFNKEQQKQLRARAAWYVTMDGVFILEQTAKAE